MVDAPVIPSYLRRHGEFDPDPDLTRLREDGGLARVTMPFGTEAWLITRLEDVRAVLADTARVSNVVPVDRFAGAGVDISVEEFEQSRVGNPLAADPPEHTRLRRMLTPAFTVRQMRRLQPRVERIVQDHLDAMGRAGAPVDLVQAFALPIPSLVICELLGVPYEDRTEFQRRSNRLLDLSVPPRARQDALRELRAYMAGLVAQQHISTGEGILAALVRKHGEDLTTEELIGIGSILLVAGHETTANMLGLGTLALLRNPDQLRIVRDRPEHVEAAVEELLRWLSIVMTSLARIVVEPIEVAGQRIEAGELVLASLPAANRDPALAARPDVLDVTRGQIGHLAFGHGLHHCLGAPLARMELRLAFPALLRRFPGLRLADPPAEVVYRDSSFIYGVASLPVMW
jgi:cytochrome P450